MKDYYKSALDKTRLREEEKDKAKALFETVRNEKEKKDMKIQKIIRPAVVLAASVVLVVTVNAVAPMLRSGDDKKTEEGKDIGAYVDKYFCVTAYAQELTNTGKVFSKDYSSVTTAVGEENGSVSFAFDFPIECKGKNVDSITYRIREGAFSITNPKGESVVVEGEKVKEEMDVPWGSHVSEAKGGAANCDRNQYQSFTVKYDNQKSEETCIEVVGNSDVWSRKKKGQYERGGYDVLMKSPEEEKKLCDFLTGDLGITCTATYKDGSSETKKILVSNEIEESNGEDEDIVVRSFSIE